ncbi:hypothetical protein [Gordonia rubripertincta]|uniref:hypothetical protein n=1 Tax=Gordonia rubripertincta TaxID=36822 RepID=UPI00403FCB39
MELELATMFGIGSRGHPPRELPEPPYSVDVVADLHAGVYPDDIAEQLRPRVLADPDSMAIWNALETTTGQLRGSVTGSRPLPDHAQAAVDDTLRSLQDDWPADTSIPLWRRHSGALIGLAAAAAVAGIAVATTFSFTGDSAEPALADGTQNPASVEVPTEATLLAALGRTDTAAFPDVAARDRCLAANGIASSATILGIGSLDAGGDPSTVILLATGTIGRFDALVVGAACDTGNPATISRTTIGDQ